MFVKAIRVSNYRILGSGASFQIDDFNVPNGVAGSGLNIVVGENGCGKTSLLEAIALPLLEYKAESFCLDDLADANLRCRIEIESSSPFSVKKTMPNGEFSARGLLFEGGLRAQSKSAYLATLCVSDRRFIPVDPDNPKPHSPDLRVSVANPFSGPRYSGYDALFLDRNRISQARSGTFGRTRFDKLMEDFNYQYIRSSKPAVDLNEYLDQTVKAGAISNDFLLQAIRQFEKMSDKMVRLDFIDNQSPFENAFFAVRGGETRQISLDRIGSGYEMVFCILYSYFLAKQNGKNLILILDEPELHLHPSLQQKLMEFLIDASSEVQVFMATHSPLLVKQSMECSNVKHMVLSREGTCAGMEERVLNYLSGDEINYLAFGLATPEYHNELYSALKEKSGLTRIKD